MNELAVAIAIVLFPGLVSVVLCDLIVVHRPRWGSFKFGVYSFLFGVFCYIFLQIFVFLFDFFRFIFSCDDKFLLSLLSVWSVVSDRKMDIKLIELAGATVCSPVVAFVCAYLVNFKIIVRLSHFLRVSTKYGDENLFSFILNSPDVNWVWVRDKEEGLTYEGKVNSFSEFEGVQELVLEEVKVFDYLTSDYLYDIPAIYLSKPLGKFRIEVCP